MTGTQCDSTMMLDVVKSGDLDPEFREKSNLVCVVLCRVPTAKSKARPAGGAH